MRFFINSLVRRPVNIRRRTLTGLPVYPQKYSNVRDRNYPYPEYPAQISTHSISSFAQVVADRKHIRF